MSAVQPKDFYKVQTADPMRIMAFLIDLYGIKIADDIAQHVASNKPTPAVVYPRY